MDDEQSSLLTVDEVSLGSKGMESVAITGLSESICGPWWGVTYLLLALCKVKKYKFVVCKATFCKGKANAICVGRAKGTVKSKGRHFEVFE
jgi:hypothetical protein